MDFRSLDAVVSSLPVSAYLQFILVPPGTAEPFGVILYAELNESESAEPLKNLRTLAKTTIDTGGVAKFFPAGVWPTEKFGVSIVRLGRGLKSIISDPYLVETADGRRVWICKP
jgi:hypothetical protein